MSPLRPTPSPSHRAIKVVATLVAAILAVFVMNTVRSGSDQSATTLSTQSLLTLPGGDEPTATAPPTSIPTTAPVSLPTPTSTPAPSPTPLPTPEPTATTAPTPTETPAAAAERSAPGEVSVANAGATAATTAADPATASAAAATVDPQPAPTEAPPVATAEPTATVEPVAVATPVPTAEPTAIPTPTTVQVQVQSVAQLETYVLDEINQVRANAGLGPVALDSATSAISRDWSQQMASGGFFEHRPGSELNVMLAPGWLQWGENIASAPDIFWAQSSLEKSPGHYANMVGPFTHVGIGVYSNGTKVWVTQNFVRY